MGQLSVVCPLVPVCGSSSAWKKEKSSESGQLHRCELKKSGLLSKSSLYCAASWAHSSLEPLGCKRGTFSFFTANAAQHLRRPLFILIFLNISIVESRLKVTYPQDAVAQFFEGDAARFFNKRTDGRRLSDWGSAD